MDKVCPRCAAEERSETAGSGPLRFETRTRTAQQAETAARWQQELKRRLATRQVETAAAADQVAQEIPDDEPSQPFRYEMKSSGPAAAAKAVSRSDAAPLASRALLRAARPIRRPDADPAQGLLELEEKSPQPEPELPGIVEDPTPDVDREILFSRFLCGSIDISLPILTGFLFTIAGSWVLNFDYFLSAALEWAGAVSLFFFFFNSVFFLLLMGQTPGMYFTELKLEAASGENPPEPAQVLLRILLFLPSAVSLFGLAWSLRDPQCRTAHDRWSGTRVVPLAG